MPAVYREQIKQLTLNLLELLLTIIPLNRTLDYKVTQPEPVLIL